MSDSPEANPTTGQSKRKRRVYQACEPCRIRKAKCDRGSDDDPRPPPCARCMRESIQQQCILASKRTRRNADAQDDFRHHQISGEPLASDRLPMEREPPPLRRQIQADVSRPPALSSPNLGGETVAGGISSATEAISANQSGSTQPHSLPIPQDGSQTRTSPSPRDELPSHHPSHGNDDSGPGQRSQHQSKLGAEQANSRARVSNSQRNLTDNVIHTLVSNENDALTLLFEAAGQQDSSALNSRRQSPVSIPEALAGSEARPVDGTPGINERRGRNDHPTPYSVATSPIATLPNPSTETLELWSRYRFVRQGWLTAREAVQYIDLFFRNLSPLSPILSSYYSDHSKHRSLIFDEPMLCATILVISSRYHILPGDGRMFHSDDIHRKFWLFWKTLFMRVMYAEEAGSNSKTRTIGTIESFLLMTEWHPRALHLLPDIDGWDYEMTDGSNEDLGGESPADQAVQKRSAKEIEGAARRSDRMSWMLLGSALTLAHELGVSDQCLQNKEPSSQSYRNEDERQHEEFLQIRRSRPRRLLYVYINQLASRLGWTSMIPRIISDSAEQSFGSETDKQWHNIMSRWISLTRLMKTASDMLFSPVITKQLLRSGNYVTSLEHFGHLLKDWYSEYQSLAHVCPARNLLLDILFIEFQFTRTYINSLAVQAVVERAFAVANPQGGPTEFLMTCVFESHSVDFGFIQEVVDGSRQILKKVLKLSDWGLLKFCPVRIYSRTISASILLLKATGLGARIEEAQISLELLDRLIRALRFDPVDELHLTNRYATLLETHVKAFRRRFLRIGRSRDNRSRDPRTDSDNTASYEQQRELVSQFGPQSNSTTTNFNQMMGEGAENFNGNDIALWADGMAYGNFTDDWMCLPLDAFDPGVMEFNSSLGASGLDFFHGRTVS